MIKPARSLWQAIAAPAPSAPPLEGDATCDVVVIGGGFTGLSTALHVAGDGRSAIVLEAGTIAAGASGRNGGLASGKFRMSFQQAESQHGREAALKLYRTGKEAIDCLEELVAAHGIAAADFHRCGYITAAHNERALDGLRSADRWLREIAGDKGTQILDRAETESELGSSTYVGGILNAKAAALHPLEYARGLARAALAAGARIHEQTPALDVKREGAVVRVRTPRGSVVAKNIVYATNGYSNLLTPTKTLAQRVVPFRSAIIATAPLGDNVLKSVLPNGRVVADTKRLLRWYRVYDRRMIFGGRGSFGQDDSQAHFDSLQKQMVEIFPQLAGSPVEFSWSGLVAMTMDYRPHIGRLDERSFYGLGYNGSGVAFSSLFGRALARMTRGDEVDLGLLGSTRFDPIPFYPMTSPGVRVVSAWYQFLDAIGR